MADNDKQTPDDNAPQQADHSTLVTAEPAEPASRKTSRSAQPKDKQDKAPPSTLGLWLVLLLTLALTLGLGGAGYWYYMNKQGDNTALLDAQSKAEQIQQLQQTKMAALDEQNLQLQQQLQALEASKNEFGRALNDLMATTEQLQRNTNDALSQLQNLDGRGPSDWLLAEADYLVRMAGRKVWLENDLRTATMLLQNADERLEQLDDPSVLPIRALIAQDVQTLSQVNPVSRTSIALALSGMLAQADNLPLETFERPVDTDAGDDDQVSESVDDWQQNLIKVWRSVVDDFISVKRTDAPVEPLMDAQQQYLVREQLKLHLMQAQSAAMASEAALYQQSLQNALKLLVEQFDLERSEVGGFISALQNLQQTDVSQALPTELAAQQPLRDLVETRVGQAFSEGARSL